jgi:hypothetical protein
MDTSFTTKLCSLILSDDYENWLQAWELIRDNMPEGITTFDELDEIFGIFQIPVDSFSESPGSGRMAM